MSNKSVNLKVLYVHKNNPNISCFLLFSPQIIHRFYELIDETRQFQSELQKNLIEKLETELNEKNQTTLMINYENIVKRKSKMILEDLKFLLNWDCRKLVWSKKLQMYVSISEIMLVTNSFATSSTYDITIKVGYDIEVFKDIYCGPRTLKEIVPK